MKSKHKSASDPFDVELHRAEIDEHKSRSRSNPWKAHALSAISQQSCVKFWIEQIGDAELYEQRWHELRKEYLEERNAGS